MRTLHLVALLGASLLLSSCDSSITEIVIVVDTDIASASSFTVEARYPSGTVATSSADLSELPAPRRLVFVHRSGLLGPVQLEIAASDGGDELVRVSRDVSFEDGQSLTLRVFLGSSCVVNTCSDTCGDDGACRDVAVAPCEYEGRSCVDAGAPDADAGGDDAGVMGPEVGCNGLDDDRDGVVDEDTVGCGGGDCARRVCMGRSYLVCGRMTQRDQVDATAACHSYGYGLVSIESSLENDCVDRHLDAMRTGEYWIGLIPKDGGWAWQDTGLEATFFAWDTADGEPNGTGACVRIDNGANAWRDSQCSLQLPFVCEQP